MHEPTPSPQEPAERNPHKSRTGLVDPMWHATLYSLSKRAKHLGSATVMLRLLPCNGFWVGAIWHRWRP